MPLFLPRDEYNLLRKLATQLRIAAADLTKVMDAAQANEPGIVYPLCSQRPSGDRAWMEGTGCDRVRDHLGKHTWELADEIARLSLHGPGEQVWTLTPGEVQEMAAWLGRPSGSFYPTDGGRVIFEALANDRIRIKVKP